MGGLTSAARTVEAPTAGERVFAVCVLLYFSGAFATFLKGSDEVAVGISTGFFVTNLVSTFSYLIGAYFLFTRCDWNAHIVRQLPWLFGLTLLPVVSVLWSDVPWITTLRAAGLVGTTVVGLYLALRYDSIALLRLLGWSLGIAAVLSFLTGWLAPAYGIGSGVFEGEWMGVFAHKNTLGSVMALGFLAFCTLGRIPQKRKWVWWSLCFLSLALIFLANSATSKLSCAFLGSLMFYDGVIRPRLKRPWLRFSIAVSLVSLAAILIYVHFEDILGVLGRDETLTGRVETWSLVWPMVQEKILLGYGYGAFWLGTEGPSAEVWREIGQGSFASAHNGYLDIWAGCGLVGVILFMLCLVAALKKAFVRWRNGATPDNDWPLYLFLFLIVYNLADSTLLLMNNIFWLVFVAVVIQLNRLEGMSLPEMSLVSAPMKPRFEHP